MINKFWTKWQLRPKNVITQILQSLYNFISTLAEDLMTKLGIDKSKLISGAYMDLLEAKHQ